MFITYNSGYDEGKDDGYKQGSSSTVITNMICPVYGDTKYHDSDTVIDCNNSKTITVTIWSNLEGPTVVGISKEDNSRVTLCNFNKNAQTFTFDVTNYSQLRFNAKYTYNDQRPIYNAIHLNSLTLE